MPMYVSFVLVSSQDRSTVKPFGYWLLQRKWMVSFSPVVSNAGNTSPFVENWVDRMNYIIYHGSFIICNVVHLMSLSKKTRKMQSLNRVASTVCIYLSSALSDINLTQVNHVTMEVAVSDVCDTPALISLSSE